MPARAAGAVSIIYDRITSARKATGETYNGRVYVFCENACQPFVVSTACDKSPRGARGAGETPMIDVRIGGQLEYGKDKYRDMLKEALEGQDTLGFLTSVDEIASELSSVGEVLEFGHGLDLRILRKGGKEFLLL